MIRKSFQQPQPGLEKLATRLETHPVFEKIKKAPANEVKERIKDFIRQELEQISEIQLESQAHPQPMAHLSGKLATAIQYALNDDVSKGYQLVADDPFLTDMFHDLLAGHFFDYLVNLGKIKNQ